MVPGREGMGEAQAPLPPGEPLLREGARERDALPVLVQVHQDRHLARPGADPHLQAERVKPVLDVALARFRREQKLLDELEGTRQKLLDRKLVDRAKGLLMARYRLSEDQAYQRLRSMAMNKNMKLAEIAQRLIDVEDLLG